MVDYNQKTLNEVLSFINTGQNCCVVNPCGSGKSYVMAAVIKNYHTKSFVIITKQANAKSYYHTLDNIFGRVVIVTYNKMLEDFKRGDLTRYNVNFILIDEAHYLGATKWNKAFLKIMDIYNPTIVGFTATPQRMKDQGTDVNIVTRFFNSNYAGNFSAKDLESSGVFVTPKYILSLYNMEKIVSKISEKIEDSDIEEVGKEKLYNKLNEILLDWGTNGSPEVVLARYLPKYMYKEYCNRILVYTVNTEDLNEKKVFIDNILHKIFPEKKIKSYVYTYRQSEDVLHNFLDDDETYIKVIYSIDKIMETVHIDDLRIMFMMRPSMSNRIITQQFGRINNINNNKEPLIVDMVDNLGVLNSLNNNKHCNYPNFEKIDYISKYINLLREISKFTKNSPYYTYKGITGTLSELCYIFDADYNIAKKLCNTDIEKAIESAKKDLNRESLKLDEDDGIGKFEAKLTDEQREYAQSHMYMINNFIRKRRIIDEDIIQNIYMKYLYLIVRYDKYQYKYTNRKVGVILGGIKYYYKYIMRTKYIKSTAFIDVEIGLDDQYYMIERTICDREIIKAMMDTISNKKWFNDRDRKIVFLWFGIEEEACTLEDIGKRYNITRERTRQIIQKVFGKLRKPFLCKSYHGEL